MREFTASTDGKIVSVVSSATQYAVERPHETLPADVRRELSIIFGINSGKPFWAAGPVRLASDSAIYMWYLFEKAQDKFEAQEEYSMDPYNIMYGNINLESPAGTLDMFRSL